MLMFIDDIRRIASIGLLKKRTWRFFLQYLWRGYSDVDTWSVDYYVARKLKYVFPTFRAAHDGFCGRSDRTRDYVLIEQEINAYVESGGVDNERFQEKVSNRLIEFWW